MTTPRTRLAQVKGNEKLLLEHYGVPDVYAAKAVSGYKRARDFYENELQVYNDEAAAFQEAERKRVAQEMQAQKVTVKQAKKEAKQKTEEQKATQRLKRKQYAQRRKDKKAAEALAEQERVLNKALDDQRVERFQSDVTEGINAELVVETVISHYGAGDSKLALRNLIKFVLEHSPYEKQLLVLMTAGDEGEENKTYYALNDQTRANLEDWLSSSHFVLQEAGSGEFMMRWVKSDGVLGVEPITPDFYKKAGKAENGSYFKIPNKKENGSFFKHYHTMDLDLSRCGIFPLEGRDRERELEEYKNTCLVNALIRGGLSEGKAAEIKTFVRSRNIPISDLGEICELLNIQINLKKIERKDHVLKYGDTADEQYNIGLIEGHYFLIEPFPCTSFALLNYQEVCKQKDFHKIAKRRSGGGFMRQSDRFISTFEAIELIWSMSDSLLVPIGFENSEIAITQFYQNTKQTITTLTEPTAKNYKEIVLKEKEHEHYENVFCDFETRTKRTLSNNEDALQHFDFIGCFYYPAQGKKGSAVCPDDCSKKLLDAICEAIGGVQAKNKKIRLIFHNSGFDFNFLIKHLYQVNIMQNGTRLVNATAVYYFYGEKFDLIIKDSYQVIPSALRDFGKMFKLQCEKEVMPYNLYNIEENIRKVFVPIMDAFPHLKEREHEQFVKNLERWSLIVGDEFNCLEYARLYCEMDCKVLAEGYAIFQGWMKEITGINIDHKMTLPGLAHDYMIKRGVYEGVLQLSGVCQMFIQGSVVGGRTMCANNEKQFFAGDTITEPPSDHRIHTVMALKKKLDESPELFSEEAKRRVMQDFDGVSLYPSAMKRLGYLKGKPKLIKDLSYAFLQSVDGYFVDVKITKVGIERSFPLLSAKNEKGVRMFENDMVGKVVRLDKIALEDAIEFQQIEFEVLRGYYFDEGYNYKIQETISFLFEERLKKKADKNPIEVVYKLIMNSAYGKTILKPVQDEVRIMKKDSEQYNTFIIRQYNWLKQITPIFGSNMVKVKTIKAVNKHFNIPQVGASVLSMSKRIMNEVMCTAEDLGCKIYYQDTDSMHIQESDIPVLSEEFARRYKRELIGKQFGQFHSDFKLDEHPNAKDLHSEGLICLGKKCYIDKLVGFEDGKRVEGFHMRMKGVPGTCISYTSKLLGYADEYEMYEEMARGRAISFDLTEGSGKTMMKFGADFTVKTLVDFTRTLKF